MGSKELKRALLYIVKPQSVQICSARPVLRVEFRHLSWFFGGFEDVPRVPI